MDCVDCGGTDLSAGARICPACSRATRRMATANEAKATFLRVGLNGYPLLPANPTIEELEAATIQQLDAWVAARRRETEQAAGPTLMNIPRRILLGSVIINTLAVILNGTLLATGIAMWTTATAMLVLLNAACALIAAYAWDRGRSAVL